MVVASNAVLGGETMCLLDVPSASGSRSPRVFSSAVDGVRGGGRQGAYQPTMERSGGGGQEGDMHFFFFHFGRGGCVVNSVVK